MVISYISRQSDHALATPTGCGRGNCNVPSRNIQIFGGQVASPKDSAGGQLKFNKASPYFFGKKFPGFWLIFSKMLIILTKPEFLNSKALELVSWQTVLGNWLSETEVDEKILQKRLQTKPNLNF